MFRTPFSRSRAAGAIGLLVAIGLLCAATPNAARAAGEVGYYRPAEVFCNQYTNELQIRAFVGRYSGFSGQSIGYSHYIVNTKTGAGYQLYVGNQAWHVRWDNHSFSFSVPWLEQGATQTWTWYDGNWEVYTMYGWSNAGWTTRGWIKASRYTTNFGEYTQCYL